MPGPQPGETRIKWETSGAHTDLYKIVTALTPFGSAGTPAVGRHSTTFKVQGGDRRSFTLTAEQTAAAGAGLGTGRHLFFRIYAIRKGEADSLAPLPLPAEHADRGPGLDRTRGAGSGSRRTTCT